MYRNPSPCPEVEMLLRGLLLSKPRATAFLSGSDRFPNIHGAVYFYESPSGSVVYAALCGLPTSDEPCRKEIFGFHIHEGGACTGNANDPFAGALSHYNPGGCDHPYHAGDLPPLFGCHGVCMSLFLTDRFRVDEVIGKTVVLHRMPDDFTSQPAGNAGEKIACGVILPG